MTASNRKPEWVGDKNKPEDENNHEFGKWCYAADQHCDHATILEACDCDYYKETFQTNTNI